jgi:hypothetical protein
MTYFIYISALESFATMLLTIEKQSRYVTSQVITMLRIREETILLHNRNQNQTYFNENLPVATSISSLAYTSADIGSDNMNFDPNINPIQTVVSNDDISNNVSNPGLTIGTNLQPIGSSISTASGTPTGSSSIPPASQFLLVDQSAGSGRSRSASTAPLLQNATSLINTSHFESTYKIPLELEITEELLKETTLTNELVHFYHELVGTLAYIIIFEFNYYIPLIHLCGYAL